ncbi:MAG: radical SAM protein [Gemmatimonadota bacterium]
MSNLAAAPAPVPDPAAPGEQGTAPCLVWEVTRACTLACSFCRSAVQVGRHFRELSTLEGFRMLNEARGLGPVRVLLAGGDPLEREDLPDLVEHAARQGLRPWITLCPTAAAAPAALARLAEVGLEGVLVRAVGADAGAHDQAAGLTGAWVRLEQAVAAARALGLAVERTADGHVSDASALRVESTGVIRLGGTAAGDVRRDDVVELWLTRPATGGTSSSS